MTGTWIIFARRCLQTVFLVCCVGIVSIACGYEPISVANRAIHLIDSTAIAVWETDGVIHSCKARGSVCVKDESIECMCEESNLPTILAIGSDTSILGGSESGVGASGLQMSLSARHSGLRFTYI